MKSELIGIYEQQYIRPYLDNNTIKRGKILYHAIVSKFISGHKCVFNNRNNIYKQKKWFYRLDNIL